jgi:putative ABC transport system ATP-binding protein/lipoprotein-releasing system ATP-binding protein
MSVSLDNVSSKYILAEAPSLKNLNVRFEEGKITAIVGETGSGKTTLLNLAAGLTRPTAGRVLFEDMDWRSLPDHRQSLLRNQKIGFVFQFPSLLPSLTALENVALPRIFDHGRARHGAFERAGGLMRSLAPGDKLGAYPRQLSTGQQQRLVIARALLNEPEILLADEPTSDLDEQTESEIMELFQRLHASTGITIVLVTHSTQLIRYGTHSIIMADGRIQPCPPPEK